MNQSSNQSPVYALPLPAAVRIHHLSDQPTLRGDQPVWIMSVGKLFRVDAPDHAVTKVQTDDGEKLALLCQLEKYVSQKGRFFPRQTKADISIEGHDTAIRVWLRELVG